MNLALHLNAGCRNLAERGIFFERLMNGALTELVNSSENIFAESYLAGVKSVACDQLKKKWYGKSLGTAGLFLFHWLIKCEHF